jgi:hypothetical protein
MISKPLSLRKRNPSGKPAPVKPPERIPPEALLPLEHHYQKILWPSIRKKILFRVGSP